MWELLLIPVGAYIIATSACWTLAAILSGNQDDRWDEDKYWAIRQLYDYYLTTHDAYLNDETARFLKKMGYPDEKEWEYLDE